MAKPIAPPEITLPADAREALRTPRTTSIDEHQVKIDPTWWNAALRKRKLGGGPVEGHAGPDGTVMLSRSDVFASARSLAQGDAGDDDVLRLLWHALAWGSGTRVRQNHRRMDAFCGEGAGCNLMLLREAAQLAPHDPAGAYQTLIRRGGGRIAGLGPSFFTKFLYFAGGGAVEHPCAILDARVATALHTRCGWESLPAGWFNWYTDTYASYCGLLRRWADEESTRLRQETGVERVIGIDEIEKWLFVQGG